jgi:mutator protein MutT
VRFVGAIIENSKCGFLLQQRDEQAPTFPLYWTLFGGKVEEGEYPKKALFRELKEEIGFTRDFIISCKRVQRNLQDNGAIQHIYYLQTKVEVNQLSLKEGKQMQYISRKDLFNRKFAFNIGEVLRSFLEKSTSQ